MKLASLLFNARDGVHERHVNLDCLRNQVLDLTEHGQVVLALDVLGVRGVQTSNQAAEWCDTNTLTNTKHRGIDVGSTGLERSVGVSNGCTTSCGQRCC